MDRQHLPVVVGVPQPVLAGHLLGGFVDLVVLVRLFGEARFVLAAQGAQGAGWMGIYWQNPANNWGTVDAGFDLAKAAKFTFWARGADGGERIEEFKMGGIMGEFSDSDGAGIGPVVLTKDWTQYTIDLAGKDLSYIIGGFCWATNADANPEGAVFYLDEIKYE